MIHISISTLATHGQPSVIEIVDKSTDIVNERAVNRIVDRILTSDKFTDHFKSDKVRVFNYVNSYRLRSFPNGRVSSSNKDVWLRGDDLDIHVDARDLIIIA